MLMLGQRNRTIAILTVPARRVCDERYRISENCRATRADLQCFLQHQGSWLNGSPEVQDALMAFVPNGGAGTPAPIPIVSGQDSYGATPRRQASCRPSHDNQSAASPGSTDKKSHASGLDTLRPGKVAGTAPTPARAPSQTPSMLQRADLTLADNPSWPAPVWRSRCRSERRFPRPSGQVGCACGQVDLRIHGCSSSARCNARA